MPVLRSFEEEYMIRTVPIDPTEARVEALREVLEICRLMHDEHNAEMAYRALKGVEQAIQSLIDKERT